MLNFSKMFFLLLLLVSVTVGLALASETELASVDSQCRGAACGISTAVGKSAADENVPFSPSPWRLVITGAALLAVRIVAKKISKPDSE